jgi:hypothetical protein
MIFVASENSVKQKPSNKTLQIRRLVVKTSWYRSKVGFANYNIPPNEGEG